MSPSGIAPQLTVMKGLFALGLQSWINRAKTSLPVPLSPVSKTVISVGATARTTPISSRISSLEATTFGGSDCCCKLFTIK